MRDRARALAQEVVLFGKLRGSQWDGLTELFVAFAEAEVALALQNAQHDAEAEAALFETLKPTLPA